MGCKRKQSRDLDTSMFRDISTSFTKAYSICYLVSPLLGLHISTMGYFPSAVFLIVIGIGLWISAEYRIKSVLRVLAILEAIACVGNFLKLIPWNPAFTVNQYISMAFLDLFQSMFLFELMKEQVIMHSRTFDQIRLS
jgi:hypothetical protein